MARSQRGKLQEYLITTPTLVWLIVLFLIPTLLVFAISFRPATPSGGIGEGWTLDTWRSVAATNYNSIYWRTFWLSALTTIICLIVAIPVGHWMAQTSPKWRNVALLLIILPFWTNFLIRIHAWRTFLHPDGFFKDMLVFLGLASEQTQLLYNEWTILAVLVYSYLPFAILPIYAAAEKFDYALLEAARDLGTTRAGAFVRVFLPGISKGILTALLIVFIPALGSYAIPDIIGGTSSEMIGNKIAQRVFSDRNLPHASALSSLLAVVVFMPMLIALATQRTKGERKNSGGEA